jgi:hypothetical protein
MPPPITITSGFCTRHTVIRWRPRGGVRTVLAMDLIIT